ncbi:MAG TPA: NAD(P)-dependent alcohol dehydrogenase [Bacteroidetes bacterium]|nr:NAD(P)-dependent alcohol dehydrogenase [Bacteroidota bacterium]
MRIHAYAAPEAHAPLEAHEFEAAAPGPQEVLIKVSHCGLCHSDLHLIDNDWRNSQYPLVPGHEVVGTVLQMGEAVQHLQAGQRVGVGWQAGSCLACEACLKGEENLCRQSQATCVGRPGGFADHLLVDARFAFPIPDALSSVDAAPLLCAGVTVYAPLRRYNVRAWHKVAILGIGGLGHLALQFAHAMGCEVTALSSSPNKKAEAHSLGADHFVNTRAQGALTQLRSSFDFILVAATADLDWKPYVKALRPNGRLCFVTGEHSLIDVPLAMLLDGQKSISGSIIGGRAMMSEMLEFAARHQIRATTECLPIADVNTALDKVRNNAARYRMVLKM